MVPFLNDRDGWKADINRNGQDQIEISGRLPPEYTRVAPNKQKGSA
jgi:hypothetical protein